MHRGLVYPKVILFHSRSVTHLNIYGKQHATWPLSDSKVIRDVEKWNQPCMQAKYATSGTKLGAYGHLFMNSWVN